MRTSWNETNHSNANDRRRILPILLAKGVDSNGERVILSRVLVSVRVCIKTMKYNILLGIPHNTSI